jgi:hypothetical protein
MSALRLVAPADQSQCCKSQPARIEHISAGLRSIPDAAKAGISDETFSISTSAHVALLFWLPDYSLSHQYLGRRYRFVAAPVLVPLWEASDLLLVQMSMASGGRNWRWPPRALPRAWLA